MKAPADDPTVAFVKDMSARAKYTMSVCNGAFWLANAGLLDGKEATTYYGMVAELARQYPKVKVVPEVRFTDNGAIMTTSGLSSGIDGALKLVSKLEGPVEAKAIALNMEYDYRPDSDYSRAAFADKYMNRVTEPWDVPPGTGVKVLQADGNRAKWEQVWELVNTKLTREILQTSLEKVATGIWTKTGTVKDVTMWTFKGDDGAPWSVTSSIEEDSKQPGRFLVHFSLARR
jgi:hypothetical protein